MTKTNVDSQIELQIMNLLQVKQTQLEMIRDRGFDISEEENILEMSPYDFLDYVKTLLKERRQKQKQSVKLDKKIDYRNILNQIYEHEDGDRQAIVAYSDVIARNKKHVEQAPADRFVKYIIDHEELVTDAIFIASTQLCNNAKQVLLNSPVKPDLFFDDDLRYNPKDHVDTPLHEKLSDEEVKTLLSEAKIPRQKFPIIKSTDNIVKYFGWRAGDIIRTTRDFSNFGVLGGVDINYRVVTI